MKKILVVLFAIVLSCTPVFGTDVDSNDFIKEYESKKGVVTFNHTTHSVDYECVTCHEGEPTSIVVDKTYGHKVCKSCHKTVKAETAPTKCNGCHVK